MWWNDEVKAAIRRKEATWREVLAASNDVWKLIKKKRKRLKGIHIRAKRNLMNSFEGR